MPNSLTASSVHNPLIENALGSLLKKIAYEYFPHYTIEDHFNEARSVRYAKSQGYGCFLDDKVIKDIQAEPDFQWVVEHLSSESKEHLDQLFSEPVTHWDYVFLIDKVGDVYQTTRWFFPIRETVYLIYKAITDKKAWEHHVDADVLNGGDKDAIRTRLQHERLEGLLNALEQFVVRDTEALQRNNKLCHADKRAYLGLQLFDYHEHKFYQDDTRFVLEQLAPVIQGLIVDGVERGVLDVSGEVNEKVLFQKLYLPWIIEGMPIWLRNKIADKDVRAMIRTNLEEAYLRVGVQPDSERIDLHLETLADFSCLFKPYQQLISTLLAPFQSHFNAQTKTIELPAGHKWVQVFPDLMCWLNQEFNPDMPSHLDTLRELERLFSATLLLEKHGLNMVMGGFIGGELINRLMTTRFQSLEQAKGTKEDIDIVYQTYTRYINDSHANEIENFFALWSAGGNRSTLFLSLFNPHFRDKFFYSDENIAALKKQGQGRLLVDLHNSSSSSSSSDDIPELMVTPYQVNRCLLQALCVPKRQWTEAFEQLLHEVIALLDALPTEKYNNHPCRAPLLASSYSADLVAVCKYLCGEAELAGVPFIMGPVFLEEGLRSEVILNRALAYLFASTTYSHKAATDILSKVVDKENWRSSTGDSLLTLAALKNWHQAVELLINHQGNTIETVNNRGFSALMLACQNGYLATVEVLLANGAEINKANEKGWSPLLLAAEKGHSNVVEQLIKHNECDIDHVNLDGFSALMVACANGHLAIVEVLIKNSAAINKVNERGWSPLLLAAKHGHCHVVEQLINHGCNIHHANQEEHSALIVACQNGHLATVDVLIKKGAEINKVAKLGWSPLLLAAEKGHSNVVERLIKHNGCDIHHLNQKGFNALMVACQNGHSATAEVLLANGAEIMPINERGLSPLLLATERGHSDVVKMLINRGCKIDDVSPDGISALMLACHYGYLAIVEVLIKNSAEINKVNERGLSPLLLATERGHSDVVKMLINRGCNIDYVGPDGFSALMRACHYGHLEILEVLIKNSAEINKVNEIGCSLLLLAAKNGHSHVVELLINHGCNINHVNLNGFSALMVACQYGHLATVNILLEKGAQINLVNERGCSPLLLAAEEGHSDIVQKLITHGCKIDHISQDGISALMAACQYGHLATVNILLAKGAQINLVNETGCSPLLLAAEKGHSDIVQKLITHGCKIDHLSQNGISALMVACQNGHLATVEVLLANDAETNQVDEDGWSPLLFAAKKGHSDVIEYLLIHSICDIDHVSHSGFSALMLACQNGHLATVGVLIKYNAKINETGLSPLLLAAEKGHSDIVQKLITHGCNIDYVDPYGFSALMLACQNGHLATVNMLLTKGAEINNGNKTGWFALLLAVQNGHSHIRGVLLQYLQPVSEPPVKKRRLNAFFSDGVERGDHNAEDKEPSQEDRDRNHFL